MFATHSAIIIILLYNVTVVHMHNIVVLLCIYSELCTETEPPGLREFYHATMHMYVPYLI